MRRNNVYIVGLPGKTEGRDPTDSRPSRRTSQWSGPTTPLPGHYHQAILPGLCWHIYSIIMNVATSNTMGSGSHSTQIFQPRSKEAEQSLLKSENGYNASKQHRPCFTQRDSALQLVARLISSTQPLRPLNGLMPMKQISVVAQMQLLMTDEERFHI